MLTQCYKSIFWYFTKHLSVTNGASLGKQSMWSATDALNPHLRNSLKDSSETKNVITLLMLSHLEPQAAW